MEAREDPSEFKTRGAADARVAGVTETSVKHGEFFQVS